MNQFLETFPIPNQPIELGDPQQWSAIEAQLSLTLPNDYKEFINHYGTGCISSFLWVFNPFSANTHLNLIEQVGSYTSQYRSVKQELGDETCPFPIFPEPGGLLPFGASDNGDTFFWLTDSENPERWKVVINQARSDDYEVYDKKMTEFLVEIIKGNLESNIFVSEYIDLNKLFVPVDEVVYE